MTTPALDWLRAWTTPRKTPNPAADPGALAYLVGLWSGQDVTEADILAAAKLAGIEVSRYAPLRLHLSLVRWQAHEHAAHPGDECRERCLPVSAPVDDLLAALCLRSRRELDQALRHYAPAFPRLSEDRAAAYLLSAGWKALPPHRRHPLWLSPAEVDWGTDEAVEQTRLNLGLRWLESRGWRTTGGSFGRTCITSEAGPCRGTCICPTWYGVVFEMRDPVQRIYVRSRHTWLSGLRRELARQAPALAPGMAQDARNATRPTTGTLETPTAQLAYEFPHTRPTGQGDCT